jgi:potassium-transporting ATPase potassium-binding subunit
MTPQGGGQILVFVAVLIALAVPLGLWMNRVYGAFRAPGLFRWLERGFYGIVRTDPTEEQDWRARTGSQKPSMRGRR